MPVLTTASRRDVLGALVAAMAVTLVGASPGWLVGADTGWFDEPALYPPEVLFPIVWTVLFALMGVAAYLVWRQGLEHRPVRVAIGLFVAQLAVNVAWTPAFFGLRSPELGLAVIVGLWVAVVATILAFDRVDRRAAALLVPYLAWVTFATYLNAIIAL